jgi:N-dimethylarginine dimethylaminohydrolase
MTTPSAYQGLGWKPRRHEMRRDLNGRLWSQALVNSEYMELRSVLLYRPGRELLAIRNPRRVQHLRRVNGAQLRQEIVTLAQAYRRCGVEVKFLEARRLTQPVPPNLVFVRDLFFATPEGAIVSRMASEVRAGEEKFAAAELAAQAIPVRATISGRGTFEGADALWLDPQTVLVGVGARTNREGFAQIRDLLAAQEVTAVAVKMPTGVQHLLGILQIVDKNHVVLRRQKAGAALKALLKRRGFETLEVNETEEVIARRGMNFVTIRPREILMAAGCTDLRRHFEQSGLRVLGEIHAPQLINAAGGLACATGILARRPRHD